MKFLVAEEDLSWSSDNAAGAFTSPLKLPMAGYRYDNNGSIAAMRSIPKGVAYRCCSSQFLFFQRS